jgi:hypothetical protein
MTWTGHEAIMRNEYKILVGIPEGIDHVRDLTSNVRITLRWVLMIQAQRLWTGLIWFNIRTCVGLLCKC